jgi:hypothetical protein
MTHKKLIEKLLKRMAAGATLGAVLGGQIGGSKGAHDAAYGKNRPQRTDTATILARAADAKRLGGIKGALVGAGTGAAYHVVKALQNKAKKTAAARKTRKRNK